MKLKIDNDVLVDEFFQDTRLLGIVAPIKDYRFCWHLNQMLQFDFRINNSIEIQLNKRQRKYFFSIYEHVEKGGTKKHYIYNNHFDGEYLLPEFKHLDFLWLMKGDKPEHNSINDMVNSVKMINGVQLVMELTNEKIKNKSHLIF